MNKLLLLFSICHQAARLRHWLNLPDGVIYPQNSYYSRHLPEYQLVYSTSGLTSLLYHAALTMPNWGYLHLTCSYKYTILMQNLMQSII